MKYCFVVILLAFSKMLLAGYAPSPFQSGNIDLKNKKYESAAHNFQEAILKDSSNISAYYNLGIAKYRLKEYASAHYFFSKTYELDPNIQSAFENAKVIEKEHQEIKNLEEVPLFTRLSFLLSNQFLFALIILLFCIALFLIIYTFLKKSDELRKTVAISIACIIFSILFAFIIYKNERYLNSVFSKYPSTLDINYF